MEERDLPHRKIIFVCVNERPPEDRVCCAGREGAEIRARLKEMVKERKLANRIRVSQSGCMDKCEQGPNVMVFPDNVWYCRVTVADCEAILAEALATLDGESHSAADG